jgi:hypothetical protein
MCHLEEPVGGIERKEDVQMEEVQSVGVTEMVRWCIKIGLISSDIVGMAVA